MSRFASVRCLATSGSAARVCFGDASLHDGSFVDTGSLRMRTRGSPFISRAPSGRATQVKEVDIDLKKKTTNHACLLALYIQI